MSVVRLGEQPLQVARCTKIINEGADDAKYIINVKQYAKFVVDLADTVSPTDIEEGMRVGYSSFGEMIFDRAVHCVD
jgi:ATP-dependent 26S proteasome regulatory subunit